MLLRASDPDFVFFLETRGRGLFLRAAPIDVSRIVARRGRRPLQGDGADVGDAGRRRPVRLRARRGWASAAPTRRGCRRSSTTRARRFSTCRGGCRCHAIPALPMRSAANASRSCGGPQGARFVLFTSYAMLRAVEPLLRAGTVVSAPGAGHGAARCAARPVSLDAATPCCWRPRASGRAWTWSATS